MFNRKHSQETKNKIRDAMLGKKKSKETMVKISEALSKKLQRNQNRYRSFLGHIICVYTSLDKYATKWKLPISEWNDFKNWSVDDKGYEELFNSWKASDFKKELALVAMRKVKKNGFTIDNLEWKAKQDYSWWSEEASYREQIEQDLDNEQRIKNPRNKEWQDKVRQQWKNKKKKE
jgi:hypothetical protein